MGRLFTALEIPSEIAINLELMRGGVEGARWIDRENYHITLRFVGEVDGGVTRELLSGLEAIASRPMELQIKGVGHFGGRKPRSLWAGVTGNGTLKDLQYSQERLCQRLGLPPDQRKFTPHVTLARLRQPRKTDVEHFLLNHSLYQSPVFKPERFVLYSSRPSRGGGPYAIEQIYPL